MTNERKGTLFGLLMLALTLILFISSLDQTIVATALPNIANSIGGSSEISWVTTAYLITSAVTTLLFGKMGDLFGRKIILQIALSLFLVGSLLCGTATNIWLLVIYRAFQGIGGGGLNSLVMAVIGDLVPPRERSRYQAITGFVPAIALIAGPFLGGFISDYTKWRWIFYINLPIGIAAFVLIALHLHLPRAVKIVRIDWLGGMLATLATVSLLLALSWGGDRYAWNSPVILTLFAAAFVTLILFLIAESKAKEPILPLAFFKSGIFNISSIQFLLATLSLFAGMVFVPMFLQSVRGYSGTAAGSFVIPMMLGIIVTSFTSGILITKTGHYKYWPILGSAVIGLGMWMLGGLSMHTSLWTIMSAMFIIGLGQGAMVQVALVAGQNAVPYTFIGAATGALNFFKSLGGAFGAAIFAAILAHELHSASTADSIPHAYGHTFMWVLPFMAASFLLALIMKEKPLSAEMEKIVSGEEEAPEF